MLEIQNIRKEYVTGDLHQTALDGVSLNLRESEMVAVLGPSGSGKSTLLNVIGGLDQYDSGDLIINGISTKQYSGRDWDSYRNHSVGFVFQSYNLIPHQTVLSNVELALTISGISKAERRRRAAVALEKVGLGDQLHKKPSQMSGGQMQRVAIARALVNNPSILLADEPTGALDSETSLQVMDLLKEVSQDRLVVMVTHNPELAHKYADRIVSVKDGRIIGDTNPYVPEPVSGKKPEHRNMGKSSMSFLSALALSFNNLRSKKGRTLLTTFAGSIGIIGIALIMALSFGFQNYIDTVQDNMLANNPLTIQTETADMMSFMMPQFGGTEASVEAGHVEEQPALGTMFERYGINDLPAFKQHMEAHYDEIQDSLSSVTYDYGIAPRVYSRKNGGYRQVNPSRLIKDATGNELFSAVLDIDAFQQIPDDPRLLSSQYQVLEGRWPEKYDEVVFVLPSPNELSDHMAYTLGIKDPQILSDILHLMIDGQEAPAPGTPLQWTYEELMDLTYYLVSVPDLYVYNEEYKVWEDMSKDKAYMNDILDKAETFKIVGVVCPQSGGSAALSPGIGYHSDLTRHMIDLAADSQIVKDQLANPDINVFTGKPFKLKTEKEDLDFSKLISIDEEAISQAFGMDMDNSAIVNLMESYLKKIAQSSQIDTSAAQLAFKSALCDMTRQMLTDHLGSAQSVHVTMEELTPMTDSFLDGSYAADTLKQIQKNYSMDEETFRSICSPLMVALITEYMAEDQLPQISPAPVPGEEDSGSQESTDGSAPTDAPETAPPTEPEPSTSPTVPGPTLPQEPVLPPMQSLGMDLTAGSIAELTGFMADSTILDGAAQVVGSKMMEDVIKDNMMNQIAGLQYELTLYMGNSITVDKDKITEAFKFNMTENEIRRLLEALSPEGREQNTLKNLQLLGYADLEEPTRMAFYMKDFEGKENFIHFLNEYNRSMEESGQDDKVITYMDMAAMMMDSVRMIVNAVSYCLIAFVSVSLLVSSIMIGIITYISVMERTREIGVLRAMGASKRNISQVFNAETFIIGLGSGILGIAISLLLLIPGNQIIHNLMGNDLITAQLPVVGGLVLIGVSMLLTLLGGLIPAKQAARKDPVAALRAE